MGHEGTSAAGWRPPPAPRIWRTDEVAAGERFAYYREAICEAFMELAPERGGEAAFSARVECVPLGDGAVNRVRASPHPVYRTRTEISQSSRQCYYLNFQLGAVCHIRQGDRTIALGAGQVGIFDSARPFELNHPPPADVNVASFWVPHEALDGLAALDDLEVPAGAVCDPNDPDCAVPAQGEEPEASERGRSGSPDTAAPTPGGA